MSVFNKDVGPQGLVRREEEELDKERPGRADAVELMSELSHQLEEARGKIEGLEEENRGLRLEVTRALGAKEVLQELVRERMR
jgi:hypothetical protein